jgi:hypothetical protein
MQLDKATQLESTGVSPGATGHDAAHAEPVKPRNPAWTDAANQTVNATRN